MIFDEATSALDNDTESAIMEAIERLHGKKTLVIIAHRLTTIEKCDAVYRVEELGFHKERRREFGPVKHKGVCKTNICAKTHKCRKGTDKYERI